MEVQGPKSKVQSPVAVARSGVDGPGEAAQSAAILVTPHPLKWYQRLAASMIYGVIEAVSFTQRYRWEYRSEILKESGPFIFCVWHNRLPFALIMYRDYVRRKQQAHRIAAIVSASKDGGVVARALEHFGAKPVRGSSSRRGTQA